MVVAILHKPFCIGLLEYLQPVMVATSVILPEMVDQK